MLCCKFTKFLQKFLPPWYSKNISLYYHINIENSETSELGTSLLLLQLALNIKYVNLITCPTDVLLIKFWPLINNDF